MSMSKSTFLILLCFIIIFCGLCLSLLPYHFYTVVVNEGINADILKIEGQTNSFLASKTITESEINEESMNIGKWENLHLANFIVPIPIEHPLFRMHPHIILRRDHTAAPGIRIGNKFTREFFSLVEMGQIPFDIKINQQKLFQLPLYKKSIFKMTPSKVWRDVFAKNLNLIEGKESNILQYTKSLLRIPYNELVYNLYILLIRVRLFPKNLESISYDSKRKVHLIQTNSVDDRFVQEILYHRVGPSIYKIYLRTKKWKKEAALARHMFLQSFAFKKSNETAHVPLYGRFQNLSYRDKKGLLGPIYFYAAWTHQMENESFIKQFIHYLERSDVNSEIVIRLYEYAFKKYGTNFSTLQEKLKETNEMHLKRKIAEESRKEHSRLESLPIKIPIQHFISTEEKARRLLQKAKDEKGDADAKDSVIFLD